MDAQINGTPIGFLHAVDDDYETWMSDDDVRNTITDIHTKVTTLVAHRESDVKAIDILADRVKTLESRLWAAYGGIVLCLLSAIVGAIL